MRLTLVGTRFSETDLERIGRLLFVKVDLPEGPIEAVVTIVTTARAGEETRKRWLLGVNIHQIPDADRERLAAYLEKRQTEDAVIVSE